MYHKIFLRTTAPYYQVLLRSTKNYSVLQSFAKYYRVLLHTTEYYKVLQTKYYNVLQSAALYCKVLQRQTKYEQVLRQCVQHIKTYETSTPVHGTTRKMQNTLAAKLFECAMQTVRCKQDRTHEPQSETEVT